ncbi:hypothetical protein GPECTOR_11g318 [Gonium pectorale]|uniref:Prenyltransferase alpha-alpha toroid domain-containing protein n=1 Tax=Gonium pectorale TaxID=33097 RepID=A0A150GQ17_GONPE|nr:hypothetical protein GPECTOR_11g318 [Gonium pectorale]|eukprot:KXZ51883.1 hypothetical protein GPECTOR_11g318 [Gonium pectorale]
MFEDGLSTTTSKAQNALEKKVLPFYQELEPLDAEELNEFLELQRDSHIAYIHSGLGQLSSGFAVLDASRTWIVYWLVHSLALLGAPLPRDITAEDLTAFLASCQHEEGGFGGGPMQLAHLAPTYAAVAAAVTLGGRALSMVDRAKAREFLFRMCIPPERGGGFSVHDGGEGDLRACYTAMAVAHMLGMDDDKPALAATAGLADYVRRCQTYEGGLGGEPGNEAHGGYTFCGVAALLLAGGPPLLASCLDMPRLLHWLVHRQGSMEGGFNGRTNKLVDGCYSFWQGGVFPLIASLPQAALQPPRVPASSAPAGELEVLAGPMVASSPPFELVRARGRAEEEMQARLHEYESLRGKALAASEAADGALRGAAARHSSARAAEARQLLDRAAAAHEAAELATTHLACVSVSAFAICPPPEQDILQQLADAQAAAQAAVAAQGQAVQGQAPAEQGGDLQQQPQQQAPAEGAAPAAQGADAAGAGAAAAPPQPPPPLCNYDALQLWILKCCQASKGGLRDKPGKPVDFYHTAYCLSGLAAAQHAPGAGVLGSRPANQLARPDPACNVVDEKLAAARVAFAAKPLPPRAEAMTLG